MKIIKRYFCFDEKLKKVFKRLKIENVQSKC